MERQAPGLYGFSGLNEDVLQGRRFRPKNVQSCQNRRGGQSQIKADDMAGTGLVQRFRQHRHPDFSPFMDKCQNDSPAGTSGQSLRPVPGRENGVEGPVLRQLTRKKAP